MRLGSNYVKVAHKILIVCLMFAYPKDTLAQQNKGFILLGTISGLKDGTLVYLTRDVGTDTVDQCLVKNGGFTFKGKVPLGTEYYYIKIDTIVKRGGSNGFLLVNDIVKVNSSMQNWPNIEVKGSPAEDDRISANQAFKNLSKELEDNSIESSRLSARALEAHNAGDSETVKKIVKEVEELSEKREEEKEKRTAGVKKYAEEHHNSLYTPRLIALMEGDISFTDMRSLYEKLTPKVKASHFGIELNERLKVGEIKVGKVVGDFIKKTPQGTTLSLKEVLSKGAFTLIDFWASWCTPCRAENPKLRKAYDLYHDKGFNVLSITLDANEDAWKDAITKDTMPWYHIRDTRNGGAIADAYNVKSVPSTFLLNRKGEIIAIGLRGDSLIAKLGELINR